MKIYFYLSNKSKSRIQLESIDIYALLFLNEQGMLSQPQFHEFYTLLKPINKAAFRRKMTRWDEANIINKHKNSLKNGYEIATIELTHSGQSILKKIKFLPDDVKLKYKSKSNLDHTLTIKQTVIEFLKIARKRHQFYIAEGGKYLIPLDKNFQAYKTEKPIIIYKKQNYGKDEIPRFESSEFINKELITKYKENGILQSFLPQHLEKTKTMGVISDWVFKIKDTFIYIEVDSGSEKIKTKRDITNTIIEKHDIKSIEGKLYRYEEIAKNDKTHKHKVIFALMDDSNVVITTNIHSNKYTRIANIKHDIAHMDYYKDWEIDVYVTAMKRFNSIVESLYIEIFEDVILDRINRYKEVFATLVTAGFTPPGENTKYTLIRDYKSRNISINNLNYVPDVLFRFFQEQYEQYFLPFFIREGNVKDMEILSYYTIPIAKGTFLYNTKILVLYKTKEELFNDILRKTKKVTINKMTRETVDNNGLETDNILFVAIDEVTEGKLRLYNADKKIIQISQLFWLIRATGFFLFIYAREAIAALFCKPVCDGAREEDD